MTYYYRPIPRFDPVPSRHRLAGGWTGFDRVECLSRTEPPRIVSADDVPPDVIERLVTPRPALAGLDMSRPCLMGILNVTPDSFSDGGRHVGLEPAVARALAMAPDVDVIDVGGESTRPGAVEVAVDAEIERTAPVIAALRERGNRTPVSIDTRKSAVAAAALDAGADIVNDVSGLDFDPELAGLVADRQVPLCLMHSVKTPATMQNNPRYDDVLLDVYDCLDARVTAAEAAGIPRNRIVVDPGIGFGKTLEHNLALLARLSVFHSLGCAILLGASRKRFIGTLGRADAPEARSPGSVAVALAAVAQGVQILRVHDTADTAQALRLFVATTLGVAPEEAR